MNEKCQTINVGKKKGDKGNMESLEDWQGHLPLEDEALVRDSCKRLPQNTVIEMR